MKAPYNWAINMAVPEFYILHWTLTKEFIIYELTYLMKILNIVPYKKWNKTNRRLKSPTSGGEKKTNTQKYLFYWDLLDLKTLYSQITALFNLYNINKPCERRTS